MEPKGIVDCYLQTLTKKYCCFEGRASRREFWTFVLINMGIGIVFNIVYSVLLLIADSLVPLIIVNILLMIFNLAILLPSLSINARRLHDIGKSGWLQLLALIPCICIIVLIWVLKPGDAGPNQYGDAPTE